MTLTRAGASARTYSSFQMTCWDIGAPRPPYSTGQPTQVQPSRPSLRSQARRRSRPSCCNPARPRPRASANSPERLASSQSRASARKAASSGLSWRSMGGFWRKLPGRSVSGVTLAKGF